MLSRFVKLDMERKGNKDVMKIMENSWEIYNHLIILKFPFTYLLNNKSNNDDNDN